MCDVNDMFVCFVKDCVCVTSMTCLCVLSRIVYV